LIKIRVFSIFDLFQNLNHIKFFGLKDLAAEKTYNNLDVTVLEALEYRRNRFDGVASCTKNETLGAIMERIVNKEVNEKIIFS